PRSWLRPRPGRRHAPPPSLAPPRASSGSIPRSVRASSSAPAAVPTTTEIAASVADDRLVEERGELGADCEVAAHQLRAVERDEILLRIDQDVCGRRARPPELAHRSEVAVQGGVHQHRHAKAIAGARPK